MPTRIEWAEESWNPVTGCTPISEGCTHCYAKRMARRLAGRFGYPESPNEFDVTYHRDRLDQPFHWKKPRRIFVCSMSDLSHDDVNDYFIIRAFKVMKRCPQHTFMVLTKRPGRMSMWVTDRWNLGERQPTLPNVWLGVTAENQKWADLRIPELLRTPAAVRFVSIEPMLSAIDLTPWLEDAMLCGIHGRVPRQYWTTQKSCGLCMEERSVSAGMAPSLARDIQQGLSWCIIGGETGPGARPMHPDWARGVRDQCEAAGVPFFFKSWGA